MRFKNVLSALLYASTSICMVFLNKIVLTTFKFPSFLFFALGQLMATIIVLGLARSAKIIKFPGASKDVLRKIFPLPVLYILNLACGLGSTKKLSLPMFVALRQVGILIVMLGEYFLLKKSLKLPVSISVTLMVLGGFVAAINDLSFDLNGYCLIMVSNITTAGTQVFVKQKLDTTALGRWGILFYNSLIAFPVCLAVCWFSEDIQSIQDYDHWTNPGFLTAFFACYAAGFVLNYAMMLCTELNSPLTTSCVGAVKNIAVTYGGMFIGGDYIYSFFNFVGISISVLGSVLYTIVTYRTSLSAVPKDGTITMRKLPV